MSKDIVSLLPAELEAELKNLGEPSFRAKQIFQWLSRGVRDFDEMTNISKPLREKLKTEFTIYKPKVLSKQVSQIDGTIKYLWELHDGNAVETVVMGYKHGNTVCISSQVGCRQGCAFCASTIGGLVRCLEPSEMLDEVLYSQIDSGKPISNIVLMGIGEPLDNFDNVMRFLELVNHPDGMNIGMRHISLSTCGLVDRMDDLAKENLQITLSVSLHAATDEKRKEIMPIARKYSVSELMAACDRYTKATGRRISYEYALIAGVNDTPEDAHLLGKLLKGRLAHLNLIPVNPIKERDFRKSEKEAIAAFTDITENKYKVSTTVRRKLGGDIDASCGQLRIRKLNRTDTETENTPAVPAENA